MLVEYDVNHFDDFIRDMNPFRFQDAPEDLFIVFNIKDGDLSVGQAGLLRNLIRDNKFITDGSFSVAMSKTMSEENSRTLILRDIEKYFCERKAVMGYYASFLIC